jgi:hypothetical protein
MKKVLFWVAIAALVPFVAWAGMSAITDTELQDVKGQTGITIDMSVSISAGDMAWEDDDGFGGAGSTGAVIQSGMTMPTISFSNVIVDAGTNTTSSYLQIDTGTTNLITGTMIISDLIIGDSITATSNSLGKFQVNAVAISFGKIKISGH